MILQLEIRQVLRLKRFLRYLKDFSCTVTVMFNDVSKHVSFHMYTPLVTSFIQLKLANCDLQTVRTVDHAWEAQQTYNVELFELYMVLNFATSSDDCMVLTCKDDCVQVDIRSRGRLKTYFIKSIVSNDPSHRSILHADVQTTMFDTKIRVDTSSFLGQLQRVESLDVVGVRLVVHTDGCLWLFIAMECGSGWLSVRSIAIRSDSRPVKKSLCLGTFSVIEIRSVVQGLHIYGDEHIITGFDTSGHTPIQFTCRSPSNELIYACHAPYHSSRPAGD